MENTASQKPLVLYGTSACHLCEEAHRMLLQLRRSNPAVAFTERDISESEELFQRYGLRIPVVVRPDGEELGWPFTPTELGVFCSGCER